jgi:hypothetical protein
VHQPADKVIITRSRKKLEDRLRMEQIVDVGVIGKLNQTNNLPGSRGDANVYTGPTQVCDGCLRHGVGAGLSNPPGFRLTPVIKKLGVGAGLSNPQRSSTKTELRNAMKRERSVLLRTCMHLKVSEDFGRAVHSAATRDQTTISEYVRAAIKERLRKDHVPIVERETEVTA